MIDASKLIKLIQTKQLDYEENIKVLKGPEEVEQTKVAMRAMLLAPEHQEYRSAVCGIIKALNDTEALEVLWKVINDPASKSRRGSLVYAMTDMNPVNYLGPLVRLVITDNFEVMSNAMHTIDNLEGKFDDALLDQLYEEVKQALTQPMSTPMPKWRQEALELLLDELEPLENRS